MKHLFKIDMVQLSNNAIESRYLHILNSHENITVDLIFIIQVWLAG